MKKTPNPESLAEEPGQKKAGVWGVTMMRRGEIRGQRGCGSHQRRDSSKAGLNQAAQVGLLSLAQ